MLVIIAVLCIPVMLFGKPIFTLMQQKKAKTQDLDKLVSGEGTIFTAFISLTHEDHEYQM